MSDGDSMISALAGGGLRPQFRDETSQASVTAADSIKGALGMNAPAGENLTAAVGVVPRSAKDAPVSRKEFAMALQRAVQVTNEIGCRLFSVVN